jgi:hypothetical protein
MARKRLGELLLERNLIDGDQLNSALAYQRQWGSRLGAALVTKGFISEGNLTRVLSESLQIPMVDLSKVNVDPRAVALVKRDVAERFEIIPIAVKEHKGRRTLLLAMADPLNMAAVDEVAFTTDTNVRPAIAQISSLRAAIERHYQGKNVDIPPLDFSKRERTELGDESDEDASMTIVRRGGTHEEIVDSSGVIDLTQEVEEAERAAAAAAHNQNLFPPDPYRQATTGINYYQGQPTGAWMMAVPQAQPARPQPPQPPPLTTIPQAAPPPSQPIELVDSSNESVEALEKKFWALMRVLARKGLITKEEFLAELRND